MADLSAVLRKTIDGLPNATPELRAKVYEKARAAIARQIDNADPPLADDVAAMRRNALEDAIGATESHYTALEGQAEPLPEPAQAPKAPPPPPPRPPFVAERRVPPAARPPGEPPRMPRAEADFARPPSVEAEARRPTPEPPRAEPQQLRREPAMNGSRGASASIEPEAGFDIPDADTSAPRYSAARPRRSAKSRRPLALGTAAVVVVALGVGAYVYRDRLAGLTGSGGTQTASAPPAAGTATQPGAGQGATGSSTPNAGGAPAETGAPAVEPRRQFTQRLRSDGTEVDDGPGPANANAFDEGTNIAAATPEAATATAPVPPAAQAAPPPAAAAPPPAAATTPPAAAQPQPQTPPQPPNNGAAPAVAQRAMFYEERTADLQGTQVAGNVVWSVVSEPPADNQPPEPAIRAEANVPNENLRMTMTIRRNLDPTLPASHVIELQFDVPPGFVGGQVANVQRLALKPSEEARGEPLIGVAGKISDGFFIIALNNLDKATETNLSLLGREEWIDIPIAYATGRRALMSIEKGVPGDRIFKQVLDAWAAKT